MGASLEELEPRNAAMCQEFSVQELYPAQPLVAPPALPPSSWSLPEGSASSPRSSLVKPFQAFFNQSPFFSFSRFCSFFIHFCTILVAWFSI